MYTSTVYGMEKVLWCSLKNQETKIAQNKILKYLKLLYANTVFYHAIVNCVNLNSFKAKKTLWLEQTVLQWEISWHFK